MIRFDSQNRFPAKQLSEFLPSRSQSTVLLLYEMILIIHIFYSHCFFENYKGLNCQKLSLHMMLLYVRYISFRSYWQQSLIKMKFNKFQFLNSSQTRNTNYYCSHWKLYWLRTSRHAWPCSFSSDCSSSLSLKVTTVRLPLRSQWTSSSRYFRTKYVLIQRKAQEITLMPISAHESANAGKVLRKTLIEYSIGVLRNIFPAFVLSRAEG